MLNTLWKHEAAGMLLSVTAESSAPSHAPKAQQSLSSSGNRYTAPSMIKNIIFFKGLGISFISPSFHNLSLMV